VKALEIGWAVCDEWARARGMAFEPAKSSLIHFCRTRTPRPEQVQLGPIRIAPSEAESFLGIILNRKLRFTQHMQHVQNRLRTQKLALSYIISKTWGPSVLRALIVYKAVIRSVLLYGASVYVIEKDRYGRGSI